MLARRWVFQMVYHGFSFHVPASLMIRYLPNPNFFRRSCWHDDENQKQSSKRASKVKSTRTKRTIDQSCLPIRRWNSARPLFPREGQSRSNRRGREAIFRLHFRGRQYQKTQSLWQSLSTIPMLPILLIQSAYGFIGWHITFPLVPGRFLPVPLARWNHLKKGSMIGSIPATKAHSPRRALIATFSKYNEQISLR